jgi:hypothetical protein
MMVYFASLTSNIQVAIKLTVTPDEGTICPNIFIMSTTLEFYFVILPCVSPLAIVIKYHQAPSPKPFEINQHLIKHISKHTKLNTIKLKLYLFKYI